MAITAQMNSVCLNCRGRIAAGDRIRSTNSGGRRRWVHVNCNDRGEARDPASDQEAPEAPPAPRIQAPPVVAPPPPVAGKEEAREKLEALIASIVSKQMQPITAALGEGLARHAAENKTYVEQLVNDSAGKTAQLLMAAMEAKFRELAVPRVIEIREKGRDPRRLDGEVYHDRFDDVVALAGAGKNILLVGPTGCGKTHTAMQLARALEVDFGIISCSSGLTEAKLLGRATPDITSGVSRYTRSDFIRIYENGGVYVFDELDGMDPNMALLINSAIANSSMGVPDRPEQPIARRHDRFICVATANTWGHGADRNYCGRNQLDEATLDRFRIGTIDFDYSPAVERSVCPDPKLYCTLALWRSKIRESRLTRVLSTRFMKDAYDMLSVGWDQEKIERQFFGGWRREEVVKVLGRELAQAA